MKQPEVVQVRPMKSDMDPTYANYAHVQVSGVDATLSFCLVSPSSQREENSGTLLAKVVARVVLPLPVIPGLIEALQNQMASLMPAQGTQSNRDVM